MSSRQTVALCLLMLIAVLPIVAVNGVLSTTEISESSIELESTAPLAYVEHPQIIIQDDAEFALQGWEGNGSSSNPYVIENLNITLNEETCIVIYNVSAHFVIRNLFLSTSGAFANNIQILLSSNGLVNNCIITGGRYGIAISTSSNIVVANSTIYSTNMGVWMSYSDSCFITSNRIYGTYTGIRFYDSANSTIMSNKVYRADAGGISMGYLTTGNRIFYNYVGWNGPGGLSNNTLNALDYGLNNIWDDNISLGNFWSGYEGDDIYAIHGSGDALDRYPTYFNDSQAPVILNGPEDLVYEFGDTNGQVINWTVHDSHPYRYEISREERVVQSDIWHHQIISLHVGEIGEGVHNYTITIVDGSGNEITDSILVYVIIYVLGDIGTELVGYASIMAVFVVMSMIVLVRKRR